MGYNGRKESMRKLTTIDLKKSSKNLDPFDDSNEREIERSPMKGVEKTISKIEEEEIDENIDNTNTQISDSEVSETELKDTIANNLGGPDLNDIT